MACYLINLTLKSIISNICIMHTHCKIDPKKGYPVPIVYDFLFRILVTFIRTLISILKKKKNTNKMFSFSTALTTLNRPVTTTTTSTITFAMISQTQLSVRMRFRMRMRMRHLDRGTGPKAFRLGLGRVWEPDYAIRCDAIPAMMGIRRLMGRDCDCTHRE